MSSGYFKIFWNILGATGQKGGARTSAGTGRPWINGNKGETAGHFSSRPPRPFVSKALRINML
jgi:hypothetical protein